ncbi:MAG: FCD domain-containing protein [Lachnospiraceae bacterium]|nr:FCD domain-containing protein [Lachnospiraceae bacterium]
MVGSVPKAHAPSPVLSRCPPAACLSSIPHILSTHQYWSLKNTTPMDEVVSYHTSIFEAILTQNAERAYQSMYRHLNRVKVLLEKGCNTHP